MSELDQCIGVALLEPSIVEQARPTCERLQRRAYRRAANWIKHSADEQAAVLSRAQRKPAILHQL